jgi:chromosome segregation ATPase
MDKESDVSIHQIEVVKKFPFKTDDEAIISNIRNYLIESNKALLGVADAQRDAEKVIANILRYQQELADEMKYLFAIGVVNLHQCRFVSKSITLRLHRAADHEIDAAEKECLINVLEGLRKQEEYFKTISGLSDDISENRERIDNAVNQIEKIDSVNNDHEKRLYEKDENDKKHDERLNAKDVKDDEHDKQLDEHEKRLCEKDRNDKKHDERLNAKDLKDDEHDKQLDDHKKRLDENEEKGKKRDERLNDLSMRVKKLENAIIPLWLKIIVIISFMLSIISIFISLAKC